MEEGKMVCYWLTGAAHSPYSVTLSKLLCITFPYLAYPAGCVDPQGWPIIWVNGEMVSLSLFSYNTITDEQNESTR